ncbi:transcription factor TFIIIC subunit [Saccharomycopsis crataegensis]|uniref:Transcription factor TFIIIC subunit n=1 Tax=Saccharomycopsis crataegensis TaxID=43959 RepID=A0AAV5QGB4_9ASCO|nr:transcription factor TFIIIC subunit [Saccharomycopsis crataegensis]
MKPFNPANTVDHILDSIACDGIQGCELSKIWKFAEEFLETPPNDVMKAILWRLLISETTKVEFLHDKQPIVCEPTLSQMNEKYQNVIIRCTQNYQWSALTGLDIREASFIGKNLFKIILCVAQTGAKGLPSSQVSKVTGQDPRCLTARIEKLTEANIISKVYIHYLQPPRLVHRKFREQFKNNYQTSQLKEQNSLDAQPRIYRQRIIQEAKSSYNQMRSIIDLKKQLGITPRDSKRFHRTIKLLVRKKYLAKVLASRKNGQAKFECIQYIRDYIPTNDEEEDDDDEENELAEQEEQNDDDDEENEEVNADADDDNDADADASSLPNDDTISDLLEFTSMAKTTNNEVGCFNTLIPFINQGYYQIAASQDGITSTDVMKKITGSRKTKKRIMIFQELIRDPFSKIPFWRDLNVENFYLDHYFAVGYVFSGKIKSLKFMLFSQFPDATVKVIPSKYQFFSDKFGDTPKISLPAMDNLASEISSASYKIYENISTTHKFSLGWRGENFTSPPNSVEVLPFGAKSGTTINRQSKKPGTARRGRPPSSAAGGQESKYMKRKRELLAESNKRLKSLDKPLVKKPRLASLAKVDNKAIATDLPLVTEDNSDDVNDQVNEIIVDKIPDLKIKNEEISVPNEPPILIEHADDDDNNLDIDISLNEIITDGPDDSVISKPLSMEANDAIAAVDDVLTDMIVRNQYNSPTKKSPTKPLSTPKSASGRRKTLNSLTFITNERTGDRESATGSPIRRSPERLSQPRGMAVVSLTKMKRLNSIIEVLEENQGIFYTGVKFARMLEKKMGQNTIVDKKTLLRDIDDLKNGGRINTAIVETFFSGNETVLFFLKNKEPTAEDIDRLRESAKYQSVSRTVPEVKQSVRLYSIKEQMSKRAKRLQEKAAKAAKEKDNEKAQNKKSSNSKSSKKHVATEEAQQLPNVDTGETNEVVDTSGKTTKKQREKMVKRAANPTNNKRRYKKNSYRLSNEDSIAIFRTVVITRSLTMDGITNFKMIEEYLDNPYLKHAQLPKKWGNIRKAAGPNTVKTCTRNWTAVFLKLVDSGEISLADLKNRDLGFFVDIWIKYRIDDFDEHGMISNGSAKTAAAPVAMANPYLEAEAVGKVKLYEDHSMNLEQYKFIEEGERKSFEGYFSPNIALIQRENILLLRSFTLEKPPIINDAKNSTLHQYLKAVILSDPKSYSSKDFEDLTMKKGFERTVVEKATKELEANKDLILVLASNQSGFKLIFNEKLFTSNIISLGDHIWNDAFIHRQLLYNVMDTKKAVLLPSLVSDGTMASVINNFAQANINVLRLSGFAKDKNTTYALKAIEDSFFDVRFLISVKDNSLQETPFQFVPIPIGPRASRIWVDIHGNINKRVLTKILKFLISLIQARPGISSGSAFGKMSRLLSYNEYHELCDWLVQKQCLKRGLCESLYVMDNWYCLLG